MTFEEEQDFFKENNLVYAHNSIWHGTKNGSHHSKETLLLIANNKLTDFIDYLFEHSEHCDHISQSEAWDEFNRYTFNKINNL